MIKISAECKQNISEVFLHNTSHHIKNWGKFIWKENIEKNCDKFHKECENKNNEATTAEWIDSTEISRNKSVANAWMTDCD